MARPPARHARPGRAAAHARRAGDRDLRRAAVRGRATRAPWTCASRRGGGATPPTTTSRRWSPRRREPDALRVVTSDAELSRRVREHGARVEGARRVQGKAGRRRVTDPRYSHRAARLARLRGARRARAGRARRASARRPGRVRRRCRPRARLRRHLPARHRPPERAHGAGCAGAGARSWGSASGAALRAYAQGFEAMGALARAGHPALYDNGWHPTAVCGGVGAAVAAAELLGAPRTDAIAIALLRASGMRAAFGSQGKSLQVGLAAASGVAAARLAAAGARVAARRRGGGLRAGDRRAASPSPTGAAPRSPRTGSRRGPAACRPTARSRPPTGSTAGPPERLSVIVHPVSLQAAAHGPDAGGRPPGQVLDPLPDRLHAAERPADGGQLRRAGRAGGRARQGDRGARRPRACSSPSSSCARGTSEIARVRAARGSPAAPARRGGAASQAGGPGGRPGGGRARRPRAPRRGRAGAQRSGSSRHASQTSGPSAENVEGRQVASSRSALADGRGARHLQQGHLVVRRRGEPQPHARHGPAPGAGAARDRWRCSPWRCCSAARGSASGRCCRCCWWRAPSPSPSAGSSARGGPST